MKNLQIFENIKWALKIFQNNGKNKRKSKSDVMIFENTKSPLDIFNKIRVKTNENQQKKQ